MHCSLGAGSPAALVDQMSSVSLVSFTGVFGTCPPSFGMCFLIASTLFLDLHFLCPLSSLTFYLPLLISLSVSSFRFAFYSIVNFLVTCVDLMSYIFLPTGPKYYQLIDLLDG